MKKQFILFCLILLGTMLGYVNAQSVNIEGYVFEQGNRGYLESVAISIQDAATGVIVSTAQTNAEGLFKTSVDQGKSYVLNASKKVFKPFQMDFDTKSEASGAKKFLQVEMSRQAGYDFEVTLAPKRESEEIVVEGIRGARIEVYNNTTGEEVLNYLSHPDKEFNVRFEQGNHYTIMVRKDGYFNKRMEAYVNVKGCILCFDGIGSVQPGVVDNLTEGNEFGVLLANVEMDPLFEGKTVELQNIYYDYTKATLRPEAKAALKSLSTVLLDNPHVKVELGSHTDSRGTDENNFKLSRERAKSAAEYLVSECGISPQNIIAHGYGESVSVNKCRDGVKCTEEEYQENRRTEMKIVGINDSKRLEKSLKQIRIAEEFKKQVLAGENETYQGEAPPSDEESTEDLHSNSMQMSEKDVIVETNTTQEIEKAKDQGTSKINDVATQTQEVISSSKKDEPVFIDSEVVEEEIIETVVSENTNSAVITKSTGLEDYTGFKIVIHSAKQSEKIPNANIFSEVIEYAPAPNNYFYLVGDFKDFSSAKDFMDAEVKQVFRSAYIVEFLNGKRIN